MNTMGKFINIWIGLVYTMALKQYYEFAKDKASIKSIIVKFDCFEAPVLIEDYYCVDPLCICNTITLAFYELEKENLSEIVGGMFRLSLEMNTWKIIKKEIANPKINCKQMIEEFSGSLLDSYKETFLSRSKEARKYAKENVLDTIDPSIVADGRCASYSEIFDVEDEVCYPFEYNNTKYIINDQYCMNPDCKCNEVILVFVKVIPDKELLDMEFAIKLFFTDLGFEIEESKCRKERAVEIASSFVNRESSYIETLKERYGKMKDAARKIKDRYKITKNVQQAVSVVRNDPCPCGSGKKFKKCCGTA